MTHSLYLFLAFSVAGVPGDHYYPPSQYDRQPVYSQPVRPQTNAPVRSWLRHTVGQRPQGSPFHAVPSTSYPATSSGQYMPTTVGSHTTGYYFEQPIQHHTTISQRPISVSPDIIYYEEIPYYVETVEPQAVDLSQLHVAEKYQDKVGRDPDFRWITGHLFYVHADGGRWVVRYALPDEIDKFGGSVVLAPGVEMRNYREGDLVCIHGQVLNENRTSHSLGGALYRVDQISMIERADP